jgi:hypothetical protein
MFTSGMKWNLEKTITYSASTASKHNIVFPQDIFHKFTTVYHLLYFLSSAKDSPPAFNSMIAGGTTRLPKS